MNMIPRHIVWCDAFWKLANENKIITPKIGDLVNIYGSNGGWERELKYRNLNFTTLPGDDEHVEIVALSAVKKQGTIHLRGFSSNERRY